MSFDPSSTELLEAGDLLGDLIREGRKLTWKENSSLSRIQEMREEAAARNLAIAQRAMAKLEWRPVGSVALINRCTCAGCGARSQSFVSFGVDMRRACDSATRMVMTTVLDPAYAKRTAYTSSVTPACIECLESFGFASPE